MAAVSAQSTAVGAAAQYAAVRAQFALRFAPVVAVCCSEAAAAVTQRCGMDFAALLAPFATVTGVGARAALDSSTAALPEFRLRFVRAADVQPANADERLFAMVRAFGSGTGASDATARWHGVGDREQAALLLSERDLTPWYGAFTEDYFDGLGASDFEFLSHPAVVLCVLSASEADPLGAVRTIQSKLPSLFSQEYAETSPHFVYVVIKDCADASPSNALEALQATYSPQLCRLLKLNARTDDSAPVKDVWTPFLSRIPHLSHKLKPDLTALCADDAMQLAIFVRDLVVKVVIPLLQSRASRLFSAVESNRSGFRNKIKQWWKKPKSATDSMIGSYPFQAQESQIRLLADTCMMLRLYDHAFAFYRTVSTDYKNDRAWRQHASTLELMGICAFMMDGARRDPESSLDQAVTLYASNNCKVYATRASYFLSEIFRQRGLHREAATIMIRASGSEASDLRAAMLIEQAALFFLGGGPSFFRKFAFHMVLAGHRFAQCGQRDHAIRCYRTASESYATRDWVLVDDHINFILGKLCQGIEDLGGAIGYYCKLLGDSRQPVARQQIFLKEFLLLAKALAVRDGAPILKLNELQVPKINTDSAAFVVNDSLAADIDSWRHLYGVSLNNEQAALHKYLDRAAMSRVCGVWENVVVELTVHNPLLIPLDVSELRLVAELEPVPGLHASSSAPSLCVAEDESVAVPTGEHVRASIDSGDPVRRAAEAPSLAATGSAAAGGGDLVTAHHVQKRHFLELDCVHLHLNPDERQRVRLTATPRCEGVLRVTGMTYCIGGVVEVEKAFQFRGPRLNRTKQHRTSVMYDTDERNVLRVIQPLPLLGVSFEALPSVVVHGQAVQFRMHLSNVGHQRMHRCRVALNLPAFFCVASVVNASSEAFLREPAVFNKQGLYVLADSLEPNESVVVTLWLHGASLGKHSVRMLFSYETDPKATGVHREPRTRFLTHTMALGVSPGLELSHSIEPRVRDPSVYSLSISATNHGSLPCELVKVTSLSKSWSTEGVDSSSAMVVAPGMSTAAVRKLWFTRGTATLDTAEVAGIRARSAAAVFHRVMCESVHDANILVFWVSGETFGVASLAGIDLHRVSAAARVLARPPVHFSLDVAEDLTHDFTRGVPCRLAVRAEVANMSSEPIRISLHALSPQERDASFPGLAPPYQYFWSGRTRTSPLALQPQESHVFELTAFCTAPGIFNLNRVRVVVHPRDAKDSESVVYLPGGCFVVVRQRSSAAAAAGDALLR